MYIYKDLVTDDEMFSDIYPMELVHDAVYKVKGKMTTKSTGVDESKMGFNKSAEDGGEDEGVEDATVTVLDIVENAKLVEMNFVKKDFKSYLKDYVKRVVAKLEELGKGGDVKAFKKGAQAFVTEVMGEFDEYQFFVGESMDADGMHALCRWDGETPYFYFFKHGLAEEKC